ncbi:MAG: hypothetical protein SV186_02505 [Candidatus Nanohaloarchaea archaeon]|nr:hypothetical protein [Candidatus Nanohaloarchaea archaeon]
MAYDSDEVEYESTFTNIEVALRDMDAYQDWEDTFEQAREQAMEDDELDADTERRFAQMLVDLYAESSLQRASAEESAGSLKAQADRHKQRGDEKGRYDMERRAGENERRKGEYEHDQQAFIEGMELLGQLSDNVSGAYLREEGEKERDRNLPDSVRQDSDDRHEVER